MRQVRFSISTHGAVVKYGSEAVRTSTGARETRLKTASGAVRTAQPTYV